MQDKDKYSDVWSAMATRNKFERWSEDFVDIEDMDPTELCKYYLSTKKIINDRPKYKNE